MSRGSLLIVQKASIRSAAGEGSESRSDASQGLRSFEYSCTNQQQLREQ
jgi:hypothetical protein